MLDKWSQGRKSAELVRDEIIDFSVGFYKENPEQEIKLEHIVLLSRILRDNYAKAEREDIASLIDLAVEEFPQTRWTYILSEVENQTRPHTPIAKPSTDIHINPSKKEISTIVPTIIYVLYLANFVLHFTGLIGVILAYINKGDDNFLQSHYQFQIRTFWIGILYLIVGIIFFMFTYGVIGFLVYIFFLIWLIVRCVRGFKYLGKQQPIPKPTSWMFG
jgi:uncharacterized membrane protein